MTERWYCPHCKVVHAEALDVYGCTLFEVWTMNAFYDQVYETEDAWEDWARERIAEDAARNAPLYKVVHGCGCSTLEYRPVAWNRCRACIHTKEDYRYVV